MKKNPSRFLIYITLALIPVLMSDCVKDADEIQISSRSKLVIKCFLSPQDTMIWATVGKSVLAGDTFPSRSDTYDNPTPVTNASVVLSRSDGASVTLLYNSRWKAYYSPTDVFQIESGLKYRLIVQTPDGMQASGTCTIPSFPSSPFDIYIDSSEVIDPKGNFTDYGLWLQWEDVPGKENYYAVSGILYLVDSIPIRYGFYYNPTIYSDLNRDGKTIISKKTENQIRQTFKFPKYISATLYSFDKNYFGYYTMLNQYSQDPFSEPVTTFTNIEGGLGIFAGYQKYEQRVDLK